MGSVIDPAELHLTSFLGVIWGGLAVAIICCCLRFSARFYTFKKLLVDDYFVACALILVIINTIFWHLSVREMYHLINVYAGSEVSWTNLPGFEKWSRISVVVTIFFYSSLWSIKISFLLFFRRLGRNVNHQKRLWWPIFSFTFATYFASIGSIPYFCLLGSSVYNAARCDTQSIESFQHIAFKLNCAWDLLTDFLIMLIPITLLWKVQMKWRRKVALAGIFSLVIITMIFAMVRTIVAVTSLARQLNIWVNMWSAVEADVAIIVACLASFRNLFSRENARRHPKPVISPNRSNLFLRGSTPRSKMKRLMDTLASTVEEPHSSYQVKIDGGIDVQSTDKFDLESSDHIALSDRVHIRQDFDVVRESVRV